MDPYATRLLCSCILQGRILKWFAISSSKASSQPRDPIHVSSIGRQILYHWATWEALQPLLYQGPLAFQKLFYHNLWEVLKQEILTSRFIQSSLVTQTVKNSPAIQEIWVWNLGQEDPLKKEMTTHSSVLAWRIPWQRGLEGYSPWGHKLLNTTEWLGTCTCINLYSGCCVL